MLENLYDDIGGKIKNVAKWIFIIEAIITIILGILLFADDSILYGFLTMICGPIVAWVSSWILYAFGELVEKTCKNENNTKRILKYIEKNPVAINDTIPHNTYSNTFKADDGKKETKTSYSKQTAFITTKKNTIICSQCEFEQPINRKVCSNCGAKFEDNDNSIATHKWVCDSCKKMRTQIPCEHCGYIPPKEIVPYWCGNCGYNGPYEGTCPNCNSGLKKYNISNS